MNKKPKFNYGDFVSFKAWVYNDDNEMSCFTFNGTIEIIDRRGTFEQNEEPSYDIMVKDFMSKGSDCLVKHIRESDIL